GHHSKHIFANRYWGDCGFIHLCFDVHNMELFKKKAEAEGYTFTVDSKESFDMEDAAGRFCYVEDPDGTLIELVETHKVPILKKYGLYL
ncbi:VOC family protein, partial [Salmonella enterica]|uniref:VOC family protein n=1 Tax=Salmonella enterica TaxID=28901 RepID=UPI003D2C0D0C